VVLHKCAVCLKVRLFDVLLLLSGPMIMYSKCIPMLKTLPIHTVWKLDMSPATVFCCESCGGCRVKGKAVPLQARTGPGGFQEVEAPRFLDSRHMKVVRLSALRIGRLYLQEIFLVLISERLSRPQGHSAAGGRVGLLIVLIENKGERQNMARVYY
jgi:hypothetical protein